MCKEDEIPIEEYWDVSSNLVHALQTFIEECKPDIGELEGFEDKLTKLFDQINWLDKKHEKSLLAGEAIKQLIENMVSASSLLDKASQVNLQLGKQHYDDHIIIPMVRSLFPVFDVITDYRCHRDDADDLTGSILSQLRQFLAVYDIEIIEHSEGVEFDPKTMKPIGFKQTDKKHLDNRLSQSHRPGFKMGQERILKPQVITLFKYQPSKTNNITLIEREEKC